ncbi:hypothetical protein RFI_16451 [Reticulomyxa filosa]|uniref:Uncharacterized protein n=1 Tax=Reticulomyxa filosa TaxID=46433 RepID=X6N3Z9_RETFI|nr:hypothetical protein RFI_16451 [Reticulomyxa filosa]|eukprot:ETO20766.1 hypothetical protein RFI_16451 [Reticulomyxa filosa]
MKHVGKYLNKYPSEIVILRVKCEKGWKQNPPTLIQLVEIIEQQVGNRLAPIVNDHGCNGNILDMRITDLLAKQWNVILFYEFAFNEYQMVTSWLQTQSELPKPLLRNIVSWIEGLPDNKKIFRPLYFGSENQPDCSEHSGKETKKELTPQQIEIVGSVEDKTEMNIQKRSLEVTLNICTKECYPTVTMEAKITDTANGCQCKKHWYLVNAQVTAKFTPLYVFHQLLHGLFGLRCDVEFVTGQILRGLTQQMIHKVNIIECDFLHPLLVRKIINVNKYYCGFIEMDQIDESEDEQLLL